MIQYSMRLFYLFYLIGIFFSYSCQKSNVQKDSSGNAIVQGTISLYVRCVHHSWGVSGLTVYLKNDATEFPGRDASLYSWSGVADSGGNVQFSNLTPGNYYLYATGYDKIFGARVFGYNGVALNSSTVTNNEVYFTLVVSE